MTVKKHAVDLEIFSNNECVYFDVLGLEAKKKTATVATINWK
jgi:hypothetical protein